MTSFIFWWSNRLILIENKASSVTNNISFHRIGLIACPTIRPFADVIQSLRTKYLAWRCNSLHINNKPYKRNIKTKNNNCSYWKKLVCMYRYIIPFCVNWRNSQEELDTEQQAGKEAIKHRAELVASHNQVPISDEEDKHSALLKVTTERKLQKQT